MVSLSLVTKNVDGCQVRVFRGRLKALTSWRAIREAGQEALD